MATKPRHGMAYTRISKPPRSTVAGTYLLRYAQESSSREDHRRTSNGEQVKHIVALALGPQAERGLFRLLAEACKDSLAKEGSVRVT